MTECTQKSFEFARYFSRKVEARFDGGTMTSDGGAVLLREADRRIGLLDRVAVCFVDGRNPELIRHRVREMVAQRILGLALGYEDLNDHEQLRRDPMLGVLSGKREAGRKPLAGKSTLNRLELSTANPSRYKKIACRQEGFDALLVELFLEARPKPPKEIVLDLDVTDVPLHGEQEGRFFHGYYNTYCYLPLYIFCGEDLLCARLRTAGQDAAAGCVEELARVVAQIRSR